MFTGLITDIGRVVDIADRDDLRRVSIASGYDAETIAIGASIACSGPCLTVVACRAETGGGSGSVFEVDISRETLDRTTTGAWRVGTALNLERSLALGAELGGHLVTGHIDGLAEIVARDPVGAAERFSFEVPAALAGFIAEKGSVALDGTSLTVNDVSGTRFGVMLIPHTLAVTTWGAARPGDRVNLEVDLLARYVARMADWRAETEQGG